LAKRPEMRGEAFNVSYGNQMTVLELTLRILSLMGSVLQPEIRNEAVNEIRKQYLNAGKARQMLGWSPLLTLEQGLNRTISWYKEFLAGEAANL
jgi:CDP-glucose 4,6-dehydratase